jgi:molecular chaperone GrpE (heat shock protein)
MNWAKVLQFGFKNWKEIAVVLSLLLVTLKTRMDYNALHKAYEISQEETKERFEALVYIHSEEIARREQALQDYKDTLSDLKEEYKNSKEELEKEKQKKTKEYERQFSQDKEALANEIISTFDFEYVE